MSKRLNYLHHEQARAGMVLLVIFCILVALLAVVTNKLQQEVTNIKEDKEHIAVAPQAAKNNPS